MCWVFERFIRERKEYLQTLNLLCSIKERHSMKHPCRLLWLFSGGSRGRVRPSPPPSLLDLTLVCDWNSYIDRIVYYFLTGWLFLKKRTLHFATKLNPRDIKKCISFWFPSYRLLAPDRKAVLHAPTVTGVHRLRNTWSSLLFQPVDNYASFTSTGTGYYNAQPRLMGRGVGEK